ncbi:short-chain dehydrogenase/reductase SDR [Hymenobacter roseosalivarius DSM 11622]|uniref:Short-chain dehydrogenase/reductase SDR n=1 Tax=Hymenobacter roseosalivarius DSM 11622 TaxID=645990 RepID=A0A1W1USR9_9BACT|nr:SDR family NAD(P)-dependent oxidoreductase [Hymenobacter roseosalivarius]SMB83841.1 short-chain dehydrogenase/reductase SDR [Hymenobacter roseosalivarius DSM 11622]
MTDLTDKVAIVTGASRGIGRAIALLLAMQGAKVVCVARTTDDLLDVAHKINGLAVPADISDEDDAQNVVQVALRHYGRLDIIICNAGVGSFNLLENMAADEWDRIFAVNVKGTFLLCKAAAPHFKLQGYGHIIGIASDVSKRTFATGAAYGASKYAQDAVLSALRKEMRPHGVKVSTIYPGLVDTYFNDSRPGSPEAEKTHLRPLDIAQAVRYVLEAPPHVVVDELMLHPLSQEW